jgi:hypothetical protein
MWTGNRGPSSAGFFKSLQGNDKYFLDYIRQYLLPFSAESFVFQFATQKYNHQGIVFSVALRPNAGHGLLILEVF